MNDSHDRALSAAFDRQAPLFERAPVQSDPAALARLVQFAAFGTGSRVLDAGCGPGLVCSALLHAGCRVVGVDLSREMIDRARTRCAAWPGLAEFHQASLFDANLEEIGPFDGAISRYVIHHVKDPAAFLARQASLLRPRGTLVVCDHITDPDFGRSAWHQAIERDRDRTHTVNPTSGQLVEHLAGIGLERIELVEEPFDLDFDEWFDRGTPQAPKDQVRSMLLEGPAARGFAPTPRPDGSIQIASIRAIVRGVKPERGSL